MKDWKYNLQRFAGTYTLTLYQDGNFSAASASPSSSLDTDDKSTLTLTPSSGYEIDRVEIVSGAGAKVLNESGTYKIQVGTASVVAKAFAKKNNKYMITENVKVSVNGAAMTELARNLTLEIGKTGAVIGVSSDGTELSISADVIASLISQGILIKI